jgi:hypothetical protein
VLDEPVGFPVSPDDVSPDDVSPDDVLPDDVLPAAGFASELAAPSVLEP